MRRMWAAEDMTMNEPMYSSRFFVLFFSQEKRRPASSGNDKVSALGNLYVTKSNTVERTPDRLARLERFIGPTTGEGEPEQLPSDVES